MQSKFKAWLDIWWGILTFTLIVVNLGWREQVTVSILQVIGIIFCGAMITFLMYQGLNRLHQKVSTTDFERFLRHRRQDCKIIYSGIFILMMILRFSELLPATADIFFFFAASFFLLIWTVIDWYRTQIYVRNIEKLH
jgi:hypothetical protein